MQDSVIRQSPYGRAGWRIIVSQAWGRESTLRPKRRPKNNAADTKKVACPLFPSIKCLNVKNVP